MEITNKIFEPLLTKNDFKKKEFADYSKIPYETVVGWKKKGYIPPYAMVISIFGISSLSIKSICSILKGI